jgi:hypothetical protein
MTLMFPALGLDSIVVVALVCLLAGVAIGQAFPLGKSAKDQD